jgi:hypothetical protein
MRMTDRVWRLNSNALPNEWGAPYGLVELEGQREPYGVSELIDKRYTDLTEPLDTLKKDHQADYLFDHARKFRRIGGTESVVAVVTAPYLRTVVTQFGSPEKVSARIHEIAQSLGIAVRVGHPADTIYLSNNDNDPTLPIVWWQPGRIALPFPPIADPNSNYVHRMKQ